MLFRSLVLRISFAPVLCQPDRFEDESQFISQCKDIRSDLGHLQLCLVLCSGKTTEAPLSVLFLIYRFAESILQTGDDFRRRLEVGEVVAEEKSLQPFQPTLLGGVREQQEARDNIGNC